MQSKTASTLLCLLLLISIPMRDKQGIGVDLTSKSNGLVKPSVILLLVCATPSCFQSNMKFPVSWLSFARVWAGWVRSTMD